MKINEKKILNDFSKRITERRNELNLSQEKLANICGFHRTYISMLENGKRNPSLISLKKLSMGLELKVNNLIENI